MQKLWRPYAYAWITLGLFLVSLIGHWLFGWLAYVDEQAAHNAPVHVSSYLVEVIRDTLENWQSEFLQLIWQVCGLAFLLFVGSPQSKEGSDRVEAKIDAILRRVAPNDGDRLINSIDADYSGRHTDTQHIQRGGREIPLSPAER